MKSHRVDTLLINHYYYYYYYYYYYVGIRCINEFRSREKSYARLIFITMQVVFHGVVSIYSYPLKEVKR